MVDLSIAMLVYQRVSNYGDDSPANHHTEVLVRSLIFVMMIDAFAALFLWKQLDRFLVILCYTYCSS